ncbi:hypothetical protein E2C01_010949 [Portunus trituberculatus]|uniref:Uncharacterized protein n=1 Tax=Portunus trituberculatus TaxID=210409 RepID=A0A5B7DA89_PORTR|nr:hypothetical protein [Portunus trituberculatus]
MLGSRCTRLVDTSHSGDGARPATSLSPVRRPNLVEPHLFTQANSLATAAFESDLYPLKCEKPRHSVAAPPHPCRSSSSEEDADRGGVRSGTSRARAVSTRSLLASCHYRRENQTSVSKPAPPNLQQETGRRPSDNTRSHPGKNRLPRFI